MNKSELKNIPENIEVVKIYNDNVEYYVKCKKDKKLTSLENIIPLGIYVGTSIVEFRKSNFDKYYFKTYTYYLKQLEFIAKNKIILKLMKELNLEMI